MTKLQVFDVPSGQIFNLAVDGSRVWRQNGHFEVGPMKGFVRMNGVFSLGVDSDGRQRLVNGQGEFFAVENETA